MSNEIERRKTACCWFKNTETEIGIYDDGSISLGSLVQIAANKWGKASMEDVTVEALNMHTHAVGYDLYDSTDYTDFIVLTCYK